MGSTVEVHDRAADDSSRKGATRHGNVDKDRGIGRDLLESLALGHMSSKTTCIHRPVWLEVDAILIYHEPAKRSVTVNGLEDNARLAEILIAEEWVCEQHELVMRLTSKSQSHTLNEGIVASSRISTERRRALLGSQPKGNVCDEYQEGQANLHLMQDQVPSGYVSDEDKDVTKAEIPQAGAALYNFPSACPLF